MHRMLRSRWRTGGIRTVLPALLLAAGAVVLIVFLTQRESFRNGPAESTPDEPVAEKDVPAPAPKPPAADPVRDPAPSIAGTVVDENGAGIWRARVRCLLGPHVPVKTARTDAQGRFRFDGLEPRTVYSIEASTRRHAPVRRDDVNVGTTDLVLGLRRGGRLEGTVLSADVGMPLSEFTVSVVGPRTQTTPFEGASGAFMIEGLADGLYRITVSASGYRDSPEAVVEVRNSATVQENFLLEPLP